jgi:putative transposase
MELIPPAPRRRAMRLAGFDYSQAGAYFITIVCQDRESRFGQVDQAEMRLNEAGRMVEEWWLNVAEKFLTSEIDEFVVMPNHFHGIVWLTDYAEGPTLATVVQWFKTMSTNAYIRGVKQDGWPTFRGKLWQRGYYDHILRNDQDLDNARRYIMGNPALWEQDRENPKGMVLHP